MATQNVKKSRKRKAIEENIFEFQDLSSVVFLDQWRVFKNVDGIDLIDLMKKYSKQIKNEEEFEMFFSLIKFQGMKFNDFFTYNNRRITILNEYFNFYCVDQYLRNQLCITTQETELFDFSL